MYYEPIMNSPFGLFAFPLPWAVNMFSERKKGLRLSLPHVALHVLRSAQQITATALLCFCHALHINVNWVKKFSPVVFKISQVKFGLSEKHTKFEKIFLMVLTNQLIYLVNIKTMRKIFSNYVCFSKSPNFKCLWICRLHLSKFVFLNIWNIIRYVE